MPEIRLLDKSVAELIAAGEVIERPSSVIKELVENSIDAGARHITVEIKHGGISYMRITDDGCGIAYDQMPTAFLRHATSKIRTGDDLTGIMTMGFRGEALASVAAVAKIEMMSRQDGDELGGRYIIEGGEEKEHESCGCPTGTTIVIKELFYNTPARLKFLKKDISEGNFIAATVDRLALSHPDISFRFIRDNKSVRMTSGDGSLLSAAKAVSGRQFADSLIPVDFSLNGIDVSGYVSSPLFCRNSRSMQTFFVNTRYIKSTTCMAALEEAYRNSMMVGKFPACILNISLSPETVDVNVHPAKTEIRFAYEKPVFDAVYFAVKNALVNAADDKRQIELEKPKKYDNADDYFRHNPEIIKREQQTLCTTNPELRSEIVRNMLDYCEKHPEVKVISLVPNDGFGWCECKECSKFYDKSDKGDFYSVSEHVYKANRIYHDLVKEVAARLHEKRPDIQLTFCAYVNYCEPAPGFRLTPGLAVHFAPYWRCINHLVDDPECYYNSNYAKDIMEWEAVKDGGEINIYEYYMGVNFYLSLPMVHFRELFHEMGWYEEHHVDGILTQFHIPHWSVYGLNYALMAKAARGESPQDAIPILFRSLFGNDGEAYLDFYWNVKEMLLHIGKCHIPHPYSLFRRTTLSQFKEIHRQAGELAARDPSNRLGREILVWTEYLVRFKSLFDDYHAGVLTEEMLDEFLAWIHSFRTTRVFVHERFDMYFQALRSCLRTGKPWVHFNIDWEDGYVIRETEMDGGK